MTLTDVVQQYRVNLAKVGSTTGLGEQIVDISVRALEGIYKSSSENTTKSKIDNHIKLLKNLYKSPVLGELIPTISGQQVVLIVSAFEVFMSDLVRCIGNDYRGLIKWPEKEASGKIDLSMLSSEVTTIGDLILGVVEQKNISFQDLQSTKRFLMDYLGIDFTMTSDEEEDLILAAALRHVIVHAGSVADSKFIKQIRNTKYASMYKMGQRLEITPDDAKRFRQVFYKAGRKIYIQMSEKMGAKAEIKKIPEAI